MIFESVWRDPNLHINKGRQWNAFSDQLSADDMNFIVSNLNYVKERLTSGQGTLVSVNGTPVLSFDATNLVYKTTMDLVNYYSKEEINEMIGGRSSLSIEVVDELPAENASSSKIYLTPVGDGNNTYNEWLYVNNKWELIGSTQVDLTNYYTKDEMLGILSSYAKLADIPVAVSQLTNDAAYAKSSDVVSKTTTINGKPLSTDIYLSSEDVGALSKDTTTLPNPKKLTIKQNGVSIAEYDGSSDVEATIEAGSSGTAETFGGYTFTGNSTVFVSNSTSISANATYAVFNFPTSGTTLHSYLKGYGENQLFKCRIYLGAQSSYEKYAYSSTIGLARLTFGAGSNYPYLIAVSAVTHDYTAVTRVEGNILRQNDGASLNRCYVKFIQPHTSAMTTTLVMELEPLNP